MRTFQLAGRLFSERPGILRTIEYPVPSGPTARGAKLPMEITGTPGDKPLPLGPVGPVAPCGPAGPVAPVGRAGPVGPAGPVAPVAPLPPPAAMAAATNSVFAIALETSPNAGVGQIVGMLRALPATSDCLLPTKSMLPHLDALLEELTHGLSRWAEHAKADFIHRISVVLEIEWLDTRDAAVRE
jgi:hypothetical protein